MQLLRDLSATQFTSGATLATKYGVSRSAVSDALKEASQLGIDVTSRTRIGYRLETPLDFLDVDGTDGVSAALRSDVNRIHLSIFDTVDSTNSALLQQAQLGAASGTCIAAELQTAGRGRRGRLWQSALGASLTFSLLWRCDKGASTLGGLSLVIGLAVADALHELGVAATLKWPNDILVAGKKIGGILIETQGDMLGPTVVVIGIGLNVALSEKLKASIDQPVTDIASAVKAQHSNVKHQEKYMMSRSVLLGTVLRHILGLIAPFNETGFAPLRARWRKLHAYESMLVDVTSAAGQYAATIVDVADDGALIIDRGHGKTRISAGEISVRVRT